MLVQIAFTCAWAKRERPAVGVRHSRQLLVARPTKQRYRWRITLA